MAVLQMQRISICVLKEDRKRVLELIQRKGVLEITNDIPEDNVFRKMDFSLPENAFRKNIAATKEAVKIVESYHLEKKSMLSMLNGRNELPSEAYDSFSDKYNSVVRDTNRICALSKSIAENKAEILKYETQLEILGPWMQLDIPLNFKGTKNTNGFIGTIPGNWELESIYEKLANQTPVDVEVINSTREQTSIFVICMKEKSEEVLEVLRTIGFSNPGLNLNQSPAEQMGAIQGQIAKSKEEIQKAEEVIQSFAGRIKEIEFLQDYETMRVEKYEVLSQLAQSKKVFFITGYIPQRDVDDLVEILNKSYVVAIELEQPGEEEDIPVALSNNGFSNPLEGTVAAYSLPGKGEIDPTMPMSLFYYMLFGLMLSDAGYGVIIAAVCAFGLMKFKDTIETPMKKVLKMYFFCGIATIFWGIMFGSYFGDIVDVVSETFFNHKIVIQPLWFFPVKEPMRMLTFAMAIGIVHLFTGLAMKLVQCVRQKDLKAAIYDVVLWYVLLTGCVLILLSSPMVTGILGINFVLSASVSNIASIGALLGAVGIILTNGRESRNPFKRFLKGLYALYGISGYLGDVLSYSRLLALGLATGVICTVINKMAAMTAGGGVLGVVFFTIVFLLGHSINIAINALGAYVHTTRLQYVEFFGKFYEGGGRAFHPFRMNTKYYKFKEKMNNG